MWKKEGEGRRLYLSSQFTSSLARKRTYHLPKGHWSADCHCTLGKHTNAPHHTRRGVHIYSKGDKSALSPDTPVKINFNQSSALVTSRGDDPASEKSNISYWNHQMNYSDFPTCERASLLPHPHLYRLSALQFPLVGKCNLTGKISWVAQEL